jgi:hypothetical protein
MQVEADLRRRAGRLVENVMASHHDATRRITIALRTLA